MFTRLRILSLLFLLCFTSLIVRLFYWQVYKGKDLSIEARSQYKSSFKIEASRGDILAADGTWLVTSGKTWLVFIEPEKLKIDRNKLVKKISQIFVGSESKVDLEIEEKRLDGLLSKVSVAWIPIRTKVSDEDKKRLEDLEIEGLGFEVEEARVYPEGSAAAHLLGFVGKDKEGGNQGYFGIEGYYDLALSGKPGFVSRESDAVGIPLVLGESKEVHAIEGVSLVTTIDKRLQITLEKKLENGVEKYGAISGTGIVMNPKTGAVLAMSSFPSYDPARYWEYGDKFFNNPSIFSSFEPGSIFKVIIMASALDAKVLKPETKCDICGGPVKIDKYLIETWNKVYYPDASMTDVIIHSDNVGMVFVSQKLGSENTYEYLNKFGFGKETGIDLEGEVSPKLRDKNKWGEIEYATASFGQGIAVTPVQMIAAVSAIANKGVYMTPYVVEKIVGVDWEKDVKKLGKTRIISQDAARVITEMMSEAASNGEAKWTYARGYRVAGKTGTAQIPIEGHYDEEKTIASFIGFSPYNDPEFVMLITLQEPKTSQWASETAAPLWYDIAQDYFNYFGIQPEK